MKDYASMSDFEINSAVHNAFLSEPYSMLFMGNVASSGLVRMEGK